MSYYQFPEPGSCKVRYAGDFLEVHLHCDEKTAEGDQAYLRTNYGGTAIRRAEWISHIEENTPVLEKDWQDLPMEKRGNGHWMLRLPLSECGLYDYKSYLLKEGRRCWVQGENARIKVEPASLLGNNTIYNAFVRQFGPNISGGAPQLSLRKQEETLNRSGYTVVPPSGTFRQLQKKLDHIQKELGFHFLMLLPVHPAPENYGRMGRYGSPFAARDFFTVDSSMAEFDTKETPLEQFRTLVENIHANGGKVMLDIPLDHTGWASAMQVHHPEWFLRDDSGTFLSPGAWGVTWADLCKLDFAQPELKKYLAKVLLHWCHQGVDGFRCDAGYMLPTELWRYLTDKVRQVYPETVFLLEGLGGPWEKTRSLLMDGGMNWAYSESFQEFGTEAIRGYFQHQESASCRFGALVNFAETHDNLRLAATSQEWSRHRTAYAALTSHAGGFAIANGVEWFATEKIDVHEASSLRWGAADNQIPEINRLNQLLRHHPAFNGHAECRQLEGLEGNVLGILRFSDNHAPLFCLIAPDMQHAASVSWPAEKYPAPQDTLWDLLTGRRISLSRENEKFRLTLAPGAVLCLSPLPWNVPMGTADPEKDPDAITLQRWKAEAMRLLPLDAAILQQEKEFLQLVQQFAREPLKMLAERSAADTEKKPLVIWRSADVRRTVMLPHRSMLAIELPHRFRAILCKGKEDYLQADSLPAANGTHLVFFKDIPEDSRELELRIHHYTQKKEAPFHVETGRLEILPPPENARVKLRLTAREITREHTGIATTLSGSYSLFHAAWAELTSKYEGLLMANPVSSYPAERLASLIRFRCWLRFRDFSHELAISCQTDFHGSLQNRARWNFRIPCGMGITLPLQAEWQLDRIRNLGWMRFSLQLEETDTQLKQLADAHEFLLIVRPDVDSRSHHEVTKAYLWAEQNFPAGVSCQQPRGFRFAPGAAPRPLECLASCGEFHAEPEWQYQVPLSVEAERGLDGEMDLFSPGYFSLPLTEEKPAVLTAFYGTGTDILEPPPQNHGEWPEELPLEAALRQSLPLFVVNRDSHKSVIAGYPWFLDWGRDTLICLPGLLEAGMINEAADIAIQFARFEENGTLPNMIRGNDTSDRATSDAPLWLFEAVRVCMKPENRGLSFWNVPCGRRAMGEILEHLASSLVNGAPNGVRMDSASGLIYSPSHYTWMDTNYPAATPRCGYPVEIQALWLNALTLLSEHGTEKDRWRKLHRQATASFRRLYFRKDHPGLVDCRHAREFCPAEQAIPDDAIRPNQLLVVALDCFDISRDEGESILLATQQLLIPGGIRSLADAPVKVPILVEDRGRRLNDPLHPFWGKYAGDEDTRRKPAYHNGTGWAWQMPFYCDALVKIRGNSAVPEALSLLSSAAGQMSRSCIGMLPEIYDGAAPHAPKGCVAQAWSMCEFFRVWHRLQNTGSGSR